MQSQSQSRPDLKDKKERKQKTKKEKGKKHPSDSDPTPVARGGSRADAPPLAARPKASRRIGARRHTLEGRRKAQVGGTRLLQTRGQTRKGRGQCWRQSVETPLHQDRRQHRSPANRQEFFVTLAALPAVVAVLLGLLESYSCRAEESGGVIIVNSTPFYIYLTSGTSCKCDVWRPAHLQNSAGC